MTNDFFKLPSIRSTPAAVDMCATQRTSTEFRMFARESEMSQFYRKIATTVQEFPWYETEGTASSAKTGGSEDLSADVCMRQ
jgi:hypothetical protein